MINRRVITLLSLSAAMFLIATNVQAGLLYFVSAGLFGLVVISYAVPVFTLRNISVSRIAGDEAYEMAPVEMSAVLKNEKRGPAFLISVEDSLAPGKYAAAGIVPGRGQVVLSYTAALPRGIYTEAPITISCAGPFGVWRAKRTFMVPAAITSFPLFEDLGTFPLLEALSSPAETLHERRGAGAGYDYLGTRDYRAGDSMRVVHWRSSARRGELVVKEFEEEKSAPVAILVDVSKDSGARGDSSLDAAARVAATIANYCLKSGHPLRIAAGAADGLNVLDRPGLESTLEWLAGLQADSGAAIEDAIDEAVRITGLRSTFILVAQAGRADWRQIAAAVQSRRARLITVLIDTDSFAEKPKRTTELKDNAAALADGRVTVYAYKKGDSAQECLKESVNVTAK
jgi:uncharacterized protein (DUF58 family)